MQESDLDSGIPFLSLDLQPTHFETPCKLPVLYASVFSSTGEGGGGAGLGDH